MTWNFDMEQAPKGGTKTYTNILNGREVTREVFVPHMLLAAGNDNVVTLTHWIEKSQRWLMFTKDVPPIAWAEMPPHPHKEKQDE